MIGPISNTEDVRVALEEIRRLIKAKEYDKAAELAEDVEREIADRQAHREWRF